MALALSYNRCSLIGFEYDRLCQSPVKVNILLYFAGVLRFLSKSLPDIVQEELSSHEFPPVEDTSLEQVSWVSQ